MSKIKVEFVKIDEARFLEVCRLYFQWKDLNIALKSETSRGLNFPDMISEQMTCFALNLLWNKGGISGDATDEKKSLIEIKATSNFHRDLSSFSPNTKFDRLIFFRLNAKENSALIYDTFLDNKSFQKLPVNSKETVLDHQKQKRRPRLSLISYVEKMALLPLCKIDIVERKIIT